MCLFPLIHDCSNKPFPTFPTEFPEGSFRFWETSPTSIKMPSSKEDGNIKANERKLAFKEEVILLWKKKIFLEITENSSAFWIDNSEP